MDIKVEDKDQKLEFIFTEDDIKIIAKNKKLTFPGEFFREFRNVLIKFLIRTEDIHNKYKEKKKGKK